MSVPIADYGIIGNTYTAALVSRGGSIDWLCLPRFDSQSVFAAPLGKAKHGSWLIAPQDPRIRGTIAAVERELLRDGFVCRYPTQRGSDGLPEGEGAFLACSFWLANSLCLIGRRAEAVALFERLLRVRNDLALLAEEYDPKAGCLLGNSPQAFSHTAIINTAAHLAEIETASAPRGNPDKRRQQPG